MSTAIILSGLSLRDKIKGKLATVVSHIPKGSVPVLSIIQVGSNDASSSYIKGKIKFGEDIGVPVVLHPVSAAARDEELIDLILRLNADPRVQGIIVQLPLSVHLDRERILETIDPDKDVDGMHSLNVKKLLRNDSSGIVPATTRGILTLLDANKIEIAGKRVLMIGRSDLVGKPTAIALLNRDATVTIAHHLSLDLPVLCKESDIIISATGVPGLLTKKHAKKGVIVIDVGITRLEGKIVGDAEFEALSASVAAISPVPGGIGPLTIASLFQNLLRKYTDDIINS
jgi:methylenetetrahydrofolate dehydrogenase (NADP+) / methenyltetrahydrofolate cyclohydrolase